MSYYLVQQPILLIEDSPEDVLAIERVLRQFGFRAPLHAYENSDEALRFLRATTSSGTISTISDHDDQKPGLILLDLNLPGTDGRELLRILKHDEQLAQIPVVVLTTSSNSLDVNECYRAGANSYSIKPVDYAAFKQLMALMLDYWFGATLLPA
jgi:CheY-like chemotaxis protein